MNQTETRFTVNGNCLKNLFSVSLKHVVEHLSPDLDFFKSKSVSEAFTVTVNKAYNETGSPTLAWFFKTVKKVYYEIFFLKMCKSKVK